MPDRHSRWVWFHMVHRLAAHDAVISRRSSQEATQDAQPRILLCQSPEYAAYFQWNHLQGTFTSVIVPFVIDLGLVLLTKPAAGCYFASNQRWSSGDRCFALDNTCSCKAYSTNRAGYLPSHKLLQFHSYHSHIFAQATALTTWMMVQLMSIAQRSKIWC